MKCIVTGSAGFIGRHLCDYLRARSDEVRELDLQNCNDITWGINHDADVLYHLAADPSREAKGGNIESNTDMAGMVARWHKQHPEATVVFASTWMVAVPGSLYGRSKLDAETILCRRIPHDKLRIVRLPNVYGPGGDGVIDRWKAAVAKGEPIEVHGDGRQIRSYIHVKQAAKLLAEPTYQTLIEFQGNAISLSALALILDPKCVNTKHLPRRDASPEIVREYILGSNIESYIRGNP